MLDFSDQPYRYFPPKYSRFWATLLLAHNRRRHLPKHLRIEGVKLSGIERFHGVLRPGDRLLFLPNHPTHADAAVVLEAMRQLGRRCLLMAAYDVFLRSRRHRFTMQRMGAFAVDRDGSCPRPMKQALATLDAVRFGLILFPEGNVYLTNDRVTPFMDGSAFIGLQAQKALLPRDRRVLVVPVSIKVTHTTNARRRVAQRFDPLAEQLGVSVDLHADPIAALYDAGTAALHRNLRQRGLDTPEIGDLGELAEHAAEQVLGRLEAKLDLKGKPRASALDRVRTARRVIHEVRLDPDRAVDHAAAATWADEAMLAYRIASYPIGYAAEHPTLDRVSETVEKLEEDLLTRMPRPMASRQAFVHLGQPLDLREYLTRHPKTRAALRALTDDVQAAVQAGVDHLNHHNPHPGNREWSD